MGGKYIVRCDIEGVSGVVSYEQAEPGRREFGFGKDMFMADLLALIRGLNDGGAELIVVYDEHYYGRNIDLDRLPDNVRVICGKPPYRKDWPGGLDETFAGLILLGYHSKRGTAGGLLGHTYEPDIRDIRQNGVSVGEIGVESAVAGDFGVPLVMLAGDSAAIAEARQLVPGAAYVCVKESLGETGAVCYPREYTSRLIYEAARKLPGQTGLVQPYQPAESGVCMAIKLNPGPYLDLFRQMFASCMTGDADLELTGINTTEVWSEYWQMKNECLAKMIEGD